MLTSYIKALLQKDGIHWNEYGRVGTKGDMGDGVHLTYSFFNSRPPGFDHNHYRDFGAFSNEQKVQIRQALNHYEEIANITFSEQNNNGTLQFGYAQTFFDFDGDGRFERAGGLATRPHYTGGRIVIDRDTGDFSSGTWGYHVWLHELGHAVGGFNDVTMGRNSDGKYSTNAEERNKGIDGWTLSYSQDSKQYTMMSYNWHPDMPEVSPRSLMLYDIAAIQALYGANWNHNSDHTTYSWAQNETFIETIWDGGGIDTFDASNQTRNSTIDLRAGHFSSIGSFNGSNAVNNLAIAYGVTIEKAFGGSGNDEIKGNIAHNYLVGNDGDDVLYGFEGNDALDGGFGSDHLVGGLGADVFGFNNNWEFGDTVYDFEVWRDRINLRGTTGFSFDALSFRQSGNDALVNMHFSDNIVQTVAILKNVSASQLSRDHFILNGNTSVGRVGDSIRPTFISQEQADDYLASNPDLIQAFGYNLAAAQWHYNNWGYYEGRTVDSFNEATYLASNGDLINAFGYNLEAATAHYIVAGLWEGRSSNGFIAEHYLESYSDVQNAFGNNQVAATRHYIEAGYSQGRDSLLGFDGGAYIASHQDLITSFGYNPDGGKQHYLKAGYSEGRDITFDANDYLAANTDLIPVFHDNLEGATEHYITHGAREGRATSGFDSAAYLNQYADLQTAFGSNTEAAMQHYVSQGFLEGRTGAVV